MKVRKMKIHPAKESRKHIQIKRTTRSVLFIITFAGCSSGEETEPSQDTNAQADTQRENVSGDRGVARVPNVKEVSIVPIEKRAEKGQIEIRDNAETILSNLSADAEKRNAWLQQIQRNLEREPDTSSNAAKRAILERKLHEMPDPLKTIIDAERQLRELQSVQRGGPIEKVEKYVCGALVRSIDCVIAKQKSLTDQIEIARRIKDGGVTFDLTLCLLGCVNEDYKELIVLLCDAATITGQSAESITALRSVLQESQKSYVGTQLRAMEKDTLQVRALIERKMQMLRNNESDEAIELIQQLITVVKNSDAPRLVRAKQMASIREQEAYKEAEYWDKVMSELRDDGKGASKRHDSASFDTSQTFRLLKNLHYATAEADTLLDEICGNLVEKSESYKEEIEVLVLELDSLPDQEELVANLKGERRKLIERIGPQ